MKAVGLRQYLPIDDPAALLDLTLPDPAPPTGSDLLVRIQAVSVNPVDTKQRAPRPAHEDPPRILATTRPEPSRPSGRMWWRSYPATRCITPAM